MNAQTKITPSAYQQAVLDWIRNGRGHAVVNAVAGSGKTKTLEMALAQIPEACHVQLFAFNNAIAKELNVRLDKLRVDTGRAYRNTRASTFHSLGAGAVAKKLGVTVRQLDISDRKLLKLSDDLFSADDKDLYGSFVCKLVGFAKGEGVGALPEAPNTLDTWMAIIQHHNMFLEAEEADEGRAIELAQDLLKASNEQAKDHIIDFDDMLYLPVLWQLRLWQNDWVLVDEAQDTNPVRRWMAKRAMKLNGRSAWVGDPSQSINGFCGASTDAIDLIKHDFNAIEMPLSVCYRCAQSVVQMAQTIVPRIEWHDAAIEGKVETLTATDALKVLGPHDAILCRKTAPLITMAFSLIARGTGCIVLGREIGAGLVKLIRQMKARDVDGLQQRLVGYRDREFAKLMMAGKEPQADALVDKVQCLLVIIENLPENRRTIPAMIESIEAMFSDHNGVLTLATVHKAKGKEWDRVAILEPECMPGKWARLEWQIAQEKNLIYVAYTRAKEHLIFISGSVK
jgi:superfamily I DNA/RNA helicase